MFSYAKGGKDSRQTTKGGEGRTGGGGGGGSVSTPTSSDGRGVSAPSRDDLSGSLMACTYKDNKNTLHFLYLIPILTVDQLSWRSPHSFRRVA
jgi:hypothetical protein